MAAAKMGSEDIVKILIEKGADLNLVMEVRIMLQVYTYTHSAKT